MVVEYVGGSRVRWWWQKLVVVDVGGHNHTFHINIRTFIVWSAKRV